MQQKENKHYIFMKSKIIVFGIIFASLTMFKSCVRSCSNGWCLLTENGYFIPQESSISRFEATKMNEGSGGWWLYGEDNKYYYGLNIEPDYSPKYFKLQKGKEPDNFDKFDYHTWEKE